MIEWTAKRLAGLFFGVLLAASSGFQSAHAAILTDAAGRPMQVIEPANCVTSECHTEVKTYTTLHGPVGDNSCNACHWLSNAEHHTFDFARQGEELCTFCHEFETGMLPVIHQPVIAGECLGCHNPHGGTDRKFIREASVERTCGRCHESVVYGKEFLHDPVKTGECLNCHRPHASKYPNLLDAVGTELCFSCHDEFQEQMLNALFTHEALKEGCLACHDVHGSDHPMEIKQPVSSLCLDCHDSIRQSTQAEYQHPPVLDDTACLTCHTPHGGNLASLMVDVPIRVCMTCHDEKKLDKKGIELITAMVRMNDSSRFQHTPVREGQCGGCHTIHGGNIPLLLCEPYSTQFNQPFEDAKYELCFSCHDERLVDQQKAEGVTDFRDGNRNLHYAHVIEGNIGHNCRVCHGVHTSKFPALVRDRVPFGNWMMTTQFEQTLTGGTCNTGCHPQLAYDRVNQVGTYPVEAMASSSPRVPIADKRQPVLAKWSGQDIHWTNVTIPVADRPSVLLFLRADQPQSRQAIKLVSEATPQVDLAQVVVVFCGENAREQAESFATTAITSWPVVADTEYDLSGSLGVEVWPTTLVIQADGRVLAHMGGAAPSRTLEVAAYLDLATNQIDSGTLKQRLVQAGLIGDGPQKRAAWYLQMGRKLLGEGKADEARKTLADGLNSEPESIDLQVEMIRALVELKQANEAMEAIEKLPHDGVSAWERDLLRGRAIALQGNWSEARRLAESVLNQKPDLGEAHYFMGTVYEHDREWEKAAEEYRAAYRLGFR